MPKLTLDLARHTYRVYRFDSTEPLAQYSSLKCAAHSVVMNRGQYVQGPQNQLFDVDDCFRIAGDCRKVMAAA